MRKIFSRSLALMLAVIMLWSMVGNAFAATYRPGAQSGPSSSYAGGVYYENFKRVPITGDNRTDVIAIALSQLGYQEGASNGAFSGEVSGRNNYVEFSYNMGDLGLGYGGSDYPWCACFVSWCLYQSHCTDQNTWKDLGRYHVGDYDYIWKEISCSQWVRQLKGAGYYKYSAYEGGSYTPKYGDLVFFQNSGGVAHIGICLYVSGGRIYTVEGNTSDSSGLEANGGGVYFKNYSLSTSYINGYGVLPYKSDSSVTKIDYSGNNPTPGLYVANANKYIYSTETGTSYSWIMDRFTMFEVTEVCSNGRLKVTTKERGGSTVTGYITNNSDRVIQLSSTATDAVDTARTNLQTVIKSAQNIRHYNYTEAKIAEIRTAYNEAVALVADTAATEAQLTASAATLRNLIGQTGSNTIALENQGIYINGRNKAISAGDCFIYSPTWNDGLITVDNANIRYTINVVCTWDIDRQVNVVKSISYGSGNSTPSIQLGELDFLIACHDWETGIASGDDPVEYSGTNYKILSELSVGDAVRLSGATALNANTDVEPAAYLKFIPVEATHVTGENVRVGNGQTVLFTPDFNEGLLTHENANVHNTLNVLAQWDDAKSAWIVVDKFAGNSVADETSNIEIVDGQVLIACHVGDSSPMYFNWNALNTAQVGQKVIFSGVSPTDGTTTLSIASSVRFEDYVAGEDTDTTGPVNLALNKDYQVTDPGTAAHIANLTDGTYTDELSFTGEWFGFACAGSNQNTDAEGNGTVVLDLGSTYALSSFRLHLYAGSNEASVAHPGYVDIYLSNNGTDYVFVGSPDLQYAASASYWATLEEAGYAARYVKFIIGSSGDSTWVFLNELEVYGTELTGGENVALTTGQQGTPVAGYEGCLTNGLLDDWYGIDTTNGSGSVVIDLGTRFQITDVLTYVDPATTAGATISVSVSPDGTNYIKTGELGIDTAATEGYWATLTSDAAVGRYVKLEAESSDAMVLISEVAVAGTVYVQSADSNVAMGKETIFTYYAGSPFTALLNDGLASNVFQYNVNNSSWFAFQNTGDTTIDNVTVNNAETGEARGIITIDLGGQAEITDVSVHLYAGTNDAGAIQPRYINVYYSADGAVFDYMGYVPLDSTQTGAYWAKLDISDSPITAGYVKLALGTMPGDLVLLNEVKVGGLMVSLNAPNEPGSLSSVVLTGDFNNWNPTPNMMNVDDTKVTTNVTLEPGSYEFKVYYNNEWFGNDGTITDTTGETPWVMDTAADNCTITTTRSGQYAFTFDRETKELSVSYVPDALYLRGSFNEWGTDIPMSADAGGTYTATVTLEAGSYEYKVASDDYFVQWPANNATLELSVKSEVTFTLDFHTGEITTTITELETPVVQPTLALSYGTVSFESEIQYNIYFNASDLDSVVEMGMITFDEELTDGTIDDAVA
ncbi:MAG: CHAP domain-containing protein, partial [Oscillospiraceae bacterium]|nr:CHAP domain-containing protein [Oscillospiraceae bacterium]